MHLLRNLYPKLFEEIDFEKNNLPRTYLNLLDLKSKKKIWWKCPEGHSYLDSVNNKVSNKLICPYCAHKKVLPGYNDLKTKFPYIAKEYSDKNKRSIDQICFGSDKEVLWDCPNGHIYSGTPRDKLFGRVSCPICTDDDPSIRELTKI